MDFFDESVLEAFVQASVDAGDAFLAGNEGADVEGILRKTISRDAVLLVELVGAGDGLDVEAGAAAEDGNPAVGTDVGIRIGKGSLVLVDVVLAPGGDKVD